MSAKTPDLPSEFLQLARVALTGRPQDIQLLIHRVSKKFKEVSPEFTEALISLLQESPTRTTPLRKDYDTPLPVDLDSRLQLLRIDKKGLDHELILDDEISNILHQIVSERRNAKSLLKHGLQPTKSILFTGPPGVGKTMAAKWLSASLGKPLLVLDLAAVMSSFLGRTGNNIRFVLDYAKSTDCILLLDELDAIAKRRDDSSEIGELKRLVTVLLQEIDDWPSTGLLVAATNHPDLLDPAVWRRFEMIVNFKNPSEKQIETLAKVLLGEELADIDTWTKVLAYLFEGKSFSEIEKQLLHSRKVAAINGEPLGEALKSLLLGGVHLSHDKRVELACVLNDSGLVSQRKAQELTGIARETIRKNIKKTKT